MRRYCAGLLFLIGFLLLFMLMPISAQLRNMSVSEARPGPSRESARTLRALEAENTQLHYRISQLEQGAFACKAIRLLFASFDSEAQEIGIL